MFWDRFDKWLHTFLWALLAGALVLIAAALAFQYIRTCYGLSCLDQYRQKDGGYWIPGVSCVRNSQFYSPSKYERLPQISKQYFFLSYTFFGHAGPVVYVANSDRYIALPYAVAKQRQLQLDDEACRNDRRFGR